jgi:DNA-binding MarR family transcriptional regulator
MECFTRRWYEKADKIPHSRFTTSMSTVFETAGITLKQAQVLEYLFLVPQATYRGIAHQFDTSPINIGRAVGALLRRGMVRRVEEQGVTVERAGWRLRLSHRAWDAWLTTEAARQQGGT